MNIKLPQLESIVDPAGLGMQAGVPFLILVLWVANDIPGDSPH